MDISALSRGDLCPAAPPTPPSAPENLLAPPREGVVLVDGENIDGCLAGIYARKPRSAERPRWEKVPAWARKCLETPDVRASMPLVERETPEFERFFERLPKLGVKPIRLRPRLGVPVVDLAISKMLRHLQSRPQADVVLLSHDGGYFEALEPLLVVATRRVAIVGFSEQIARVYREHSRIEIYDLQHDLAAFDIPPPRETPVAVDIDDFDPSDFM